MTSKLAPMCTGCVHLRAGTVGDEPPVGRCAAYPDGIPAAIYYDFADHRLPLPDDGGIVFDAKTPAAARYVLDAYGDEPAPYEGPWPDGEPDVDEVGA